MIQNLLQRENHRFKKEGVRITRETQKLEMKKWNLPNVLNYNFQIGSNQHCQKLIKQKEDLQLSAETNRLE